MSAVGGPEFHVAVRFILGRSGTGKTHYCVDALLAAIAAAPRDAAGCLLLVPEQATFQMERELARRSPTGGFAGAEVLSFSRLATRIFEVTGGAPRLLAPQTRALALRSIVTRRPDSVAAFGAAARSAGFIQKLDRVIDELLREGVRPEDLSQAAAKLDRPAARQRAAAVAAVYSLYLAWLGPERADPAYRLALLRARLLAGPRLTGARIWVDGFAGFTGQELETLVVLARRAARVEITLLCEPAEELKAATDPFDLFRRTAETAQRLLRRFADERVEVEAPLRLDPATPPRFGGAAALARLERALAGAPPAPAPAAAGIVRVARCATHLDELRRAAGEIRRAVIESGGALRFRDCAVIVRDLRPLAHDVVDVFAEYGVPCFLDERRPVAAHALARVATALLEAARSDLSTTAGLRLLRTQLMPAHRDELERLEQLLIETEIHGVAAWMEESWTPGERAGAALVAVRRRIAGAVAALRRLMAPPAPPPTGRDWGRALYAALDALAIPRRTGVWIDEARARGDFDESEQHRMVWESLCGFLDEVDDVLADVPMSIDEFESVLSAALGEMSYGIAPPTLDQVLIGSIERSRNPELRRVWLVAMNDGIFPAPPAEDALLLPDERSALAAAGLPAPRTRRDEIFAERLLGYIAMTRASEQVALSFATLGDDDSELFPSPFIDELMRAFPDLNVEAGDEAGRGTALPAIPAALPEFGRRALRSNSPAQRSLWRGLETRLLSHEAARARVEFLLRGRTYQNVAADVAAQSRDDGLIWVGSPSELEDYVQCPFKHLARHRLHLNARRGPEPLEWSLGSAAHAVLAHLGEALIARDPKTISDEEWTTLLRSAIANWREGDLVGTGRSAQSRFMAVALEAFLEDVVRVHAARWKIGRFRPIAAEQRFGRDERGAPTRPARLGTSRGVVGLRGSIDRVDACEIDGVRHLLIYDYKPIAHSIHSRFLTGHRLQAISYSLISADQFARGDGETRWSGAFIAPLYPKQDELENKYVRESGAAEQRMVMYRPTGLFDADIFDALDPTLAPGARSTVVSAYRRKDGALTGDAVARDELDAYARVARETIGAAAAGIRDGCVAIEPLIEKHTLACNSCEYKRLCRFEPVFNTPRVAEVILPRIGQDARDGAEESA